MQLSTCCFSSGSYADVRSYVSFFNACVQIRRRHIKSVFARETERVSKLPGGFARRFRDGKCVCLSEVTEEALGRINGDYWAVI